MLRAKQFFAGAGSPRSARLSTYLAPGSYILGKLSFAGDAHIEGVVIGEINAAGKVTIGEGGRVTSQMRAGSVVVTGEVRGEIVGSERVEVCRTAVVLGNLTSPILTIDAGAGLEGHFSTMYQSAHNHQNESELVQMGFPFFKAGEQRAVGAEMDFPECRPSDASRPLQRLDTRDMPARVGPIRCDECLRPIRWWSRRVWLADRQCCAHLRCWKGRLFFKELVADQIRCSQLSADETSTLSRSSSADSELRELQASAATPGERLEWPGAPFARPSNPQPKRALTKITGTAIDVLHDLRQHLRHFLAPRREDSAGSGFHQTVDEEADSGRPFQQVDSSDNEWI
jgi:cytoskeletal protein CcmA (bactofilin family)